MASPKNLPVFELPNFGENDNGWGPGSLASNKSVLSEWDGLPYQAFNKADRVGRIVDWVGVGLGKKSEQRDRYMERVYGSSATAGGQYDYIHDGNEDSTFQLVDSTRTIQRPQQRNFRRTYQYRRPGQRGLYEESYGPMSRLKAVQQRERMRQQKQWQRRGGGGGRISGRMANRRGQQGGNKGRQPSIQVKTDWVVLEELDAQRLGKLSLPNIESGQDIKGETYGVLNYYDKSVDKVNVKQPIALERFPGGFYSLTTTEDPVIQKLAQSGVGNVFATDIILATLMAASRSVYSWDIVAYRIQDKLFFDKRNVGSVTGSPIDALTVNETAIEPPTNDGSVFNNAKDLASEALYINQNFKRQVLVKNTPGVKHENERIPFEDPKQPANSAYKYRTWNLGTFSDNGKQVPIKLVARTEHDSVTVTGQKIEKLTVKCFNEWETQSGGSSVDWRRSLENQKGAVLANEMKNNSCKLAKWTLQAVLAGSDAIKIGFVSRANMRNSAHHVILGTQMFRPTELATQIGLHLDNCWGILRMLIDFFMRQPPGKYLMLKDPYQSVVRIYSLPQGTFDSSDDEEEESTSSSDDESGESDDNEKTLENDTASNVKSALPNQNGAASQNGTG